MCCRRCWTSSAPAIPTASRRMPKSRARRIDDVYNKVNAALQAGQPPEVSAAYQNQAAFYRAQNAVVDLNPFIKSKKYGLSDEDLKDYFQTFLDGDANPQFQGERLDSRPSDRWKSCITTWTG